jgi:hypothetical protein
MTAHARRKPSARQALIAGMVYFARESGCLLVAEGIETAAERETLRRIGVPFGQGSSSVTLPRLGTGRRGPSGRSVLGSGGPFAPPTHEASYMCGSYPGARMRSGSSRKLPRQPRPQK